MSTLLLPLVSTRFASVVLVDVDADAPDVASVGRLEGAEAAAAGDLEQTFEPCEIWF